MSDLKVNKARLLRIAAVLAVVVIVAGVIAGCGAEPTATPAPTQAPAPTVEAPGEAPTVAPTATAAASQAADPNEEYYLLSVLAGHEYWQDMKVGFEDAAKLRGVKGIYTGPADSDGQAPRSRLVLPRFRWMKFS